LQEVLSMFQITDFQFFPHLLFAIHCDGNGKAVLECRALLGIAFKARTEKLQDCFDSSDGESLLKHSLHGFGHE
jgi:hypothetical protein